jgi:hypothetical protein
MNSLLLMFLVIGACASHRPITGPVKSGVVAPAAPQPSSERVYRARVAFTAPGTDTADNWTDIVLLSASDADKQFCELVLKNEIRQLEQATKVRDVRECVDAPLPVQPGTPGYVLVQPSVVTGEDLVLRGLLDANYPLVPAKATVTTFARHATEAQCEQSRKLLEVKLAEGAAQSAENARDWLTSQIQELERERALACEERQKLAEDCGSFARGDALQACKGASHSVACHKAQEKRLELALRCSSQDMAIKRCSSAEKLLQSVRERKDKVAPRPFMAPSCQRG